MNTMTNFMIRVNVRALPLVEKSLPGSTITSLSSLVSRLELAVYSFSLSCHASGDASNEDELESNSQRQQVSGAVVPCNPLHGPLVLFHLLVASMAMAVQEEVIGE